MSKRSERNKDQKLNANEPWEQPIYDVDSESTRSRSSQHQQKRGSTVFLSIVLFVLFLCVLVPSLAGIWLFNQKKNAEIAVSQSSTQKVQSTESSSEKSTEATKQSESESQSSTHSTENQVEFSSSSSSSAAEEQGAATIKVLAGEGPSRIAARAGITVQKLLELNGMTMQNFHFTPGQEVKIR